MSAITELERKAGMGAIPHDDGVAFRVWAPHADQVFVAGTFNDWSSDAHPLDREESGYWYLDVAEAEIGDEYRYVIHNGDQILWRIDPYARQVTNSIGNAVVHDPHFDWEGDDFRLPPLNELIIYELHAGTFNGQGKQLPGGFGSVSERFDHLLKLGANTIELMPSAEFAGDISWGYNPSHIFAVESSYGGPLALKQFVKDAHHSGIGVILDVTYNHFGPSDLHLWRFDGWSENEGGGIYMYNDWRAQTPWGATRPDYGRGEVRQFLRDNALMWLEDYHIDGLRYDMTLFMHSVNGSERDIPDGWSFTQWINREIRERCPGKITIAEDLQNNEWLTKPPDEGGAGFHAQWDAKFVHPVRSVVALPNDNSRSMTSVADAIRCRYNLDSFQRVIYSESHDEVANGRRRVPSEVSPSDPEDRYAQKRSTLAAVLVLTSPGVPMLFQGQEFLQGGWFQDSEPLDWQLVEKHEGIVKLYADLIQLRLNKQGVTRGLSGQNVDVHHVDQAHELIAFHRWEEGGPGDDVVVVANFSNQTLNDYKIGFSSNGDWRLRLNTDWEGYSDQFDNVKTGDVRVRQEHATISIAPYSALVYSQD